jgi:GTP cyclohydrolase I
MAEAAIRTLIAYVGEDPEREGLRATPSRVVRTYDDLYGGYSLDARSLLTCRFEDVGGYEDIVFVGGIAFTSHCEHHMMPFSGMVHIAYLPDGAVVGLSKLLRVVDAFARRLQTQERLTSEIAAAIEAGLSPRGVAVAVDARHSCMEHRGIARAGSRTSTYGFKRAFRSDPVMQARFLSLAEKEASPSR